jgi:homoserine O-acetyltransferase
MMLEIVRNDPAYNNGNYTTQPRSLRLAAVFFGIATAGGTLNYQKYRAHPSIGRQAG